MKPPRSKLKYKINKLHDRAKQGGAYPRGPVQLTGPRGNFYLILKLILMIPFDFESENHQKTEFPDFPRDITFCHFCDEISSGLALTTSYRMMIHYFPRHQHSNSSGIVKKK